MSPHHPLAQNQALLVVLGLLGLVIVGYTLFVATPYLSGPSLTVSTPLSNSTSDAATVRITGTTARVSYLTINDQEVALAEDGTFAVERAFPSGYTVLVVRARDRFDRETVDTINFIHSYKPVAHGIQTKEESGQGAEGGPEGEQQTLID